jgi:hypothetical protein
VTHYVFEEVRRTGFKSVPCAACGRKLPRQRTFAMTINPWNVNADGTQRSRRDIQEALGEKIAAWQAEPETHSRCLP